MSKWIVALLAIGLTVFMAGAGCDLSGLFPTDPGIVNDDPGPDDNGDDGLNDDGSNDDGNNDGSNDDGGDDDGNDTGLTIVKTAIPVRHDAGLKCGNDLIAFGTETADNTNVGVSYVIPSTNPTAGTPVTDSALYDNSDFAVGGRNIFLAGNNGGSLAYQVSVYNVDSAAITKTFTPDEIRLAIIPIDQNEPGNIRADGNYCVVICDPTIVADGKVLKVIDAGTNPPTLIAIDVDSSVTVHQVDVDAATKRVVVASYDTLYVYSIDNPTAAPTTIAAPNGIANQQIDVSGDYAIGMSDAASPQAFLANLATGTYIAMTDSEAIDAVAVGGTKFGFFANFDSDDAVGSHYRAAVGTLPGPGFEKAALAQYIDGSYTSNGLVGFAQTMVARPDGTYLFAAGYKDIGTGEYLQYSTGSASFTVPADQAGGDSYGVPATDVSASQNTVGFKTGANTSAGTDTTLGYIRLQ